MKILWTVSLTAHSGATPQAILVAGKLRERGHDVSLLSVPPLEIVHGEPVIESEFKGVPVVYCSSSLAEAVEAVDPDILVAHTLHPSIVTDLTRIQGNYPVVARVGINIMELLIMELYKLNAPSVANFLRSVDHLICASPNTVSQMRGLGVPEERITYIPTVVDESKFKLNVCEDPTILTMGRLSAVKNHITTIQTFKLVKEEVPEAELAIAGRGQSLRQILDSIMKGMALSDYKFLGFYENLNHLFSEVSIFLLPSITENMPQSVLEAYATGTPCVLSDCGWSSEFEACLKAPHDDPRALADRVVSLLQDRDFWLETRLNQFNELRRKFSLKRALDRYEEVFRRYTELEPYFAGQDEDVIAKLKELGIPVKGRGGP